MNSKFFDADYYERGIESGKSLYQNYRWEPELTIPMAMTMIDYLGIKRGDKILDFGCAKGFLVKAFRLLHREAWGYDISNYALENAEYCTNKIPDTDFDFCIAKDVFEHMNGSEIKDVLEKIKARFVFVIVPLGNFSNYIAPSNNLDKSHLICEPGHWWSRFFINQGFKIRDFKHRIDGIKDSYYEKYPEGHGFYVIKK